MSTLHDFLTRFGDSLAQRVTDTFTILHDPFRDRDPDLDARLVRLGRPCYPAQAEAAKAIAKAFFEGRQRAVYLCGEMGVGKSQCALATIALAPTPLRVLILCPPHLVDKWQREAHAALPRVRTINFNGPDALTSLATLADARRTGLLRPPDIPELWVLGRERAKLHHGWQPAYHSRLRHCSARDHGDPAQTLMTWREPACLACGKILLDTDGLPLTPEVLARKRRFCPHCHEPTFGVDRTGPRRYAPAEFIKRHLKGVFDLLVADEIHESKGEDTGQGQSFGALASACRRTLALTGTLLNGYADSLYFLLWRSHPRQMLDDDLTYRGVQKWMERYGILERITKIPRDPDDARQVKGKTQARTIVRRKPGISPLVLGRHLLPTTIFLRLADVADALPPYEERVVNLAMSPALADAYRALERDLTDAVRTALKSGNRRLLATYLQTLLCYPDQAAFREAIVYDGTVPIAGAPALGGILPKEEELLAICEREVAQGRRVLVYATFTGTRDITPRLKSLLEDAGLRTAILKASVAPSRRETWIAERVKEGVDVLICNPELVKTGLDLYAFPTFVFFQTGYNTYTLRQASRRAWRIGQSQPCEVIYLTYQHTMQEKALTLIATKLEASLALEGEITEAGLATLADTTDSLVLELARALVNRVGAQDSAEAIWARLRKRELEQDLTLTAFRPTPTVTAISQTATQIGDKTLIVDLIQRHTPRKRRISRIEVTAAELADTLKTQPHAAQLAFF